MGCQQIHRGEIPEPGPDATVLDGPHFRVVLHFPCPTGAQDALDAAESAWPFVVDWYGMEPKRISSPLEIHVYEEVSDYERVEQSLTRGRFRSNLAFAHHQTRTGHIALQPKISQSAGYRIGLPSQTLRLIAHEAFHIATYYASSNARWFPDWLDEGAATWVEQQAMVRIGQSPADESYDPWAGTYSWLIARLLRRGSLPDLNAFLSDQLAGLRSIERYAYHKTFFRFLVEEHPGLLARLLKTVKSECREDLALRLKLDMKASSHGGVAGLEAAFQEFVLGLQPVWVERRRSLECAGDEWVQIAFRGSDALAFSTVPTPGRHFELATTAEVIEGGREAMFVILGFAGVRHLRVTLSRNGDLRIQRHDGRFARTIARAAKRVAPAGPVTLRVQVRLGHIRVFADETLAVEAEVPARELEGAWGLGIYQRSAGIWKDVRLNSLNGPHTTQIRAPIVGD
ncbi:MAG: hypothetical protein AAF517_18010 [Planctomycetota bacterium]